MTSINFSMYVCSRIPHINSNALDLALSDKKTFEEKAEFWSQLSINSDGGGSRSGAHTDKALVLDSTYHI